MAQQAQHNFDQLKKALSEKEHLIEEKNREILRLRMATEEATLMQYGKRSQS